MVLKVNSESPSSESFQNTFKSFLESLKSLSKSLTGIYHRSSSYSHERLIKVSSRSHKLAMHGWLEQSCYILYSSIFG